MRAPRIDTPIGTLCTTFILHKRNLDLVGDAIFRGCAYPPREIAEALPFEGNALPSDRPSFPGAPHLPYLQLQSGEYVWGCEVWWAEKSRVDHLLHIAATSMNLTIGTITLAELRALGDLS